MNCDDFLPALETGGPLEQMRARQHAARCPRCAAVAARLAAVKAHWAEEAPPALSDQDRRLWEQAAEGDDSPALPIRRRIIPWRLAVGLAAAACLLIVATIVVTLMVRDEPKQIVEDDPPATAPDAERRRVGAIHVRPAEAAVALAGLSDAVNELEGEMRQLRGRAETVEARRQVALALDRFDQFERL